MTYPYLTTSKKGNVYELVVKHICIAAKLTCSFKKDLKEKTVVN